MTNEGDIDEMEEFSFEHIGAKFGFTLQPNDWNVPLRNPSEISQYVEFEVKLMKFWGDETVYGFSEEVLGTHKCNE